MHKSFSFTGLSWLITLVIWGLSFSRSYSQDTIKVLFVGNSFTYVYDLPGLFNSLSLAAGHPVVIAQHTPGGMSVGDTVQGTAAHMNNPVVFALIRSNNWDYLVLQDNQGRFVHDYGVFPASSLVIEGHIRIRDSLLYHHPCAHMLWFAGWGPKSGYPPYASTGTGLIDKIYNNYRYLQDTAGQVIAPFGPAWQRIIANNPGIDLWDTDDVHPGLHGSYLNACVLFSTIFKDSPEKSTFNPGISMPEDSILKATAWQTTIDSLYDTGLNEITPELIQIDAYAGIVGNYDSCFWYRNDTLIQIGNGMLVPQDGEYYVIAKDNNGCNFRTLTYFLSNINGLNDQSPGAMMPVCYPNPANQSFRIHSVSINTTLEVSNVSGQILYEELYSPESEVNCAAWPAGLYLIHFKTKHEPSIHKKLIIYR